MVLQVRYGNLSVSLGNELTPTQVKNIPTVHWNADDGSYYLLCMTGMLITILRTLHCLVAALCDSKKSAEYWILGLCGSIDSFKKVS